MGKLLADEQKNGFGKQNGVHLLADRDQLEMDAVVLCLE
jgi:hypothetical protein